MFGEKIDVSMLDKNLDYSKYSSADITGLFLRYKNNPKEALKNFDKIEKIVFKSNKSAAIEMLSNKSNNKNSSYINLSEYKAF
jgi:hypothetical protein